jgi:hypothetical protein
MMRIMVGAGLLVAQSFPKMASVACRAKQVPDNKNAASSSPPCVFTPDRHSHPFRTSRDHDCVCILKAQLMHEYTKQHKMDPSSKQGT